MDNDFNIISTGFDESLIAQDGNKFLIGNGFLGCRGTLSEYTKEQTAACNLPFLYDQNGGKWRETVNAPNPLYSKVFINGKELNPTKFLPFKHSLCLNMKCGELHRVTQWQIDNAVVTIETIRFASFDNPNLLCEKMIITSSSDTEAELIYGIDCDVWDINGPHFEIENLNANDSVMNVCAKTLENKIPLSVALKWQADGLIKNLSAKTDSLGIIQKAIIRLQKGKPFTFIKYAAVIHSISDTQTTIKTIINSTSKGFDLLRRENAEVWAKKWAVSDVLIEGDERAQKAIRYSIYHLLIAAPYKYGNSISARGISGQTYKGAVFWDSEIFLFPFFINTDLKSARSLIKYRIDTLNGARRKAASYGYEGAFFAWESQETGDDACSDFNVTDVFTSRPMRTYFKDKQIHISADIVYAIWQYFIRTDDKTVLTEGGAEVIFECARFYYTYAYYSNRFDRYELLDVIGPDEYHERVNNNAYTNYMAKKTFDIAIKTKEYLEKTDKIFFQKLQQKISLDKDWANIVNTSQKLYVPPKTDEIIEQFDGYFKLEDVSVEEVRSRLLHKNEYWGGANGVAANTKIIKQADVVTMLYLAGDDFSLSSKIKNLEYYEPKTEHGSSLSMCMHSLLLSECGLSDRAYPYFLKSAEIDLLGGGKQFAGGIYIGGTHPAANGGAYMSVVYGFCGLKIIDGNISIKPRLPHGWEKVCFSLIHKGNRYNITVEKESFEIKQANRE